MTEQELKFSQLQAENANLRRELADTTAQLIWVQGGNYAKIDREIRRFGYKLSNPKNSSDLPRIVAVEVKDGRRQ